MSTGKRVLVTAGNTIVPIDQVRSITNIFKGKTGTEIAIYLADHGYQVTLITSNPTLILKVLRDYARKIYESPRTDSPSMTERKIEEDVLTIANAIEVVPYRTYDELLAAMEHEITTKKYDIVIHSAAVSDYYVHAVCVMEGAMADNCSEPRLIEIDKSKKVSSDYEDMYLYLKKTQKIIGLIREPWGFKGQLVMFKLQVGISDMELMEIADKSRRRSQADIIVANCLEWARERAIIISSWMVEGVAVPRNLAKYLFVKRENLPKQLMETLQQKLADEKKNDDNHV